MGVISEEYLSSLRKAVTNPRVKYIHTIAHGRDLTKDEVIALIAKLEAINSCDDPVQRFYLEYGVAEEVTRRN